MSALANRRPRRRRRTGRPVRGRVAGAPRNLDARLRRARAHRRSRPLHRHSRQRELRHPRPAARRDAQHADDRAVRVAVGAEDPVLDADAAGRRDRSRGVRSRAGAAGRGGRRRSARRHACLGGRNRARRPCVRSSATTGSRARLLIMACGANYAFQRRVRPGAAAQLPAHARSASSSARHAGDVELHFGHDIAPGGFAWAVPIVRESGTYVRVGRHDRPRSGRRLLAHARARGRAVGHRGHARASAAEDPAARRHRSHVRRSDARHRRRRRAGEADDRRRHSLQHPEREAGAPASRSTRSRAIGSTRRRWRRTSAPGATSSAKSSPSSARCAIWSRG